MEGQCQQKITIILEKVQNSKHILMFLSENLDILAFYPLQQK
jgi:hypothetical protein